MIKNEKAIRILTAILVICIIATIAFIFSNSAKSVEESSEQSTSLYVEVKPVIDPVIVPVVGEEGLTHNLFRKMAHFAEFFALGFFVSALLFVRNQKSKKWVLCSLIFGFITATADETLQIFTSRGAGVKDVFIDFFGYSTAFFGVLFVWWILNKIMCKGR
ncbi:MAG: VanZ family protein [Bacillota bacterium]